MLHLPFAAFHNPHNNPVLTHCNILCTQQTWCFQQMHSYLKKNLICKQVWWNKWRQKSARCRSRDTMNGWVNWRQWGKNWILVQPPWQILKQTLQRCSNWHVSHQKNSPAPWPRAGSGVRKCLARLMNSSPMESQGWVTGAGHSPQLTTWLALTQPSAAAALPAPPALQG